jgi:hypothetical protein
VCSNKADLQLIEEMGIYPDITIRERKITLKVVAIAVRGVVKMRRLMEAWKPSKELQQTLLRKLDEMRAVRDGKAVVKGMGKRVVTRVGK